jgi:hypothetical protein
MFPRAATRACGILPPAIVRNRAECRQPGNVRYSPDALKDTMTKKLLFVTTLLLVVGLVAFAADVTGKWTYEQAGRQGGPARQVTITLKQDGNTLTGSVPGMGRGGQEVPPVEIKNGKVDGDKVSFDVVREFNGNTMTTKYEGTVSGNEMKLKITRDTPNGPMTNEVTAKKATT